MGELNFKVKVTSADGINGLGYSQSRSVCLKDKVIRKEVSSFETQPATHDVTSLTCYSSNVTIYANVQALVISLH